MIPAPSAGRSPEPEELKAGRGEDCPRVETGDLVQAPEKPMEWPR